MTRDTWPGEVNRPLSLNRWNYVEANPINFVDPTGMITCKDSSDKECMSKANQLRVEASIIKQNVRSGVTKPVEGFAKLVDLAQDSFVDMDGIMWALTNILIGIDPNAHDVWKRGLTGQYPDISPATNPYFIGEDWLPYKNDPTHPNKRHSERGDWREEYWDNTPNQAFHFWYMAATTYYDHHLIAHAANIAHDPYFLEGICGDDLENLKGIKIGGKDITDYTTETSIEDFRLSIAGIDFGRTMWRYGWTRLTKPGNWIRNHLATEN